MDELNNFERLSEQAKKDLLAINEKALDTLTPKIKAIKWENRKPSSEDLFLFAEYNKALMSEAWLRDIDYRFQIERVISETGLTDSEVHLYCEIGGWIGLDRRMEGLDADEKERIWRMFSQIDSTINDDDLEAKAAQARERRDKEIAELNKLLGFGE